MIFVARDFNTPTNDIGYNRLACMSFVSYTSIHGPNLLQ